MNFPGDLARAEIFPPAPKAQTNILRQLGMDHAPIKRIVYFTTSPFIGDFLAMRLPVLLGFHQLYPRAKVHVYAPFASLLASNAWLEPHPIDFSEWITPDLAQAIARDRVHESPDVVRLKDQYLAVLSSLDREDTYLVYEANLGILMGQSPYVFNERWTGRPFQIFDFGRHFYDLISLSNLPNRGVLHELYPMSRQLELQIPRSWPQSENLKGMQDRSYESRANKYEAARAQLRWLFGRDQVRVDKSLLAPGMSTASFDALMNPQWLKPNAPYILLNLNRGNKWAAASLAAQRFEFLREIVVGLLRKYPAYNIAVVPFERMASNDPAQNFKIAEQEFASSRFLASIRYNGRVAIVPEDKTAWAPAIDNAALVISQDGGLVHIANIRRDPRTVLTFSQNGEAADWSDRDQPVVTDFSKRAGTLNATQFWNKVQSSIRKIEDPCWWLIP